MPKVIRGPAVPPLRPRSSAAGHATTAAEAGPGEIRASGCAKQKRLLFTDTTLRDAHQSLLATRVRTYDMLAIADAVAHLTAEPVQPGDVGRRDVRHRHALSAGRSVGSAGAAARSAFPTSAFRCCCAAPTRSGIRTIRTTWCAISSTRPRRAGHRCLPHLRFAELAAEHEGGHGRGAGRPARSAKRRSATPATSSIRSATKYSLNYYVKHGQGTGAHGDACSCDQGHGGLCKPYAAYALVKALRDEIGIPIHFHTHDTSGINAASHSEGRPMRAWMLPTARSRR